MPVEIKELIIRAVAQRSEEHRTEGEPGEAKEEDGSGKEAIVEACVRQVLRIFKQTRER